MIPDHTAVQVHRSGKGRVQEFLGLPMIALTRDAKRGLWFVVHAAGWLHSIELHGRC